MLSRIQPPACGWSCEGGEQEIFILSILGASLIAQLVKNPPAMQETLVQFLGWEDPLEEG